MTNSINQSINQSRYFQSGLLSATQIIESADDLCACDVSVDELVGASQQFDVSSLYNDDAEIPSFGSYLLSHLLLCSAWKLSTAYRSSSPT